QVVPGMPPPVPQPAPPAKASPPPAATIARMPGEPWYYGFLDGYAKLCLALGIVQFGFCFLATVSSMSAPSRPEPPADASLGMGLILACSFGVMVGTVLMSATVLLAVDAARNLRHLRYD